ncbi:MAG: hypothetical protein HKO57_01670, partial [Akkermansiaceae bacterium]|nr:hypothetical protein [Akkermansiaceae bacterium]
MFLLAAAGSLPGATLPLVGPDLVFEETDGLLVFEAEHFYVQKLDDERKWHLTTRDLTPDVAPDGDPSHIGGASGGAYLELLPDTRRSHSDKLIRGKNFSLEPGKMAVLTYKVHINNPGKYYIWARAFSTNTEDNGFHVGLDGEWPASAQRWQTVEKNKWHWESKQRTPEVHAGERHKLFLEIDKPGLHTISISMREDGIELDRLLFTRDREYVPRGLGPETKVKAGRLPRSFPLVDDAAPVRRPQLG